MEPFNKKALVLAVLSCMFSVQQVAAQTSANEIAEDDDVEKITVYGSVNRFGATKSNTPIVETARSISIETSDAFNLKGALSLSQSVTYMPGVVGEPYGFATRGDFVTARGLTLPRYRDSIQELFGNYNTTRAELFTIEQVEVLRGPASVLYGQGSPGGIVNYVSKTARFENSGEIQAQVGTFSRKQLGVDVNRIIGDDESLAARMVGVYRDADTQVDNVTDDTLVLIPSVTYAPSDDTSITLFAMHQDTESDSAAQFIPVVGTLLPLADGSFLDQDVYIGEPGFNKFETESNQLSALVEHAINDNLVLNATALWRDGEADYHQAWAAFTGAGNSRYLNDIAGAAVATATTVPRSFYQADNEFEQMAFDVRLTAEFDTGDFSHELLFGAQYQDVETDNNTSYFYGGGALTGDFRYVLDLANPVYPGAPAQAVFDAIYNDSPTQKVDDIGVYLSDQISYENWKLTAGLRYDKVDNDNGTRSQSDNAVSMSVGALYAFDNGFAPYVSYAESFETVVGLDANNNQLEPEEAEQLEIGVKYQPRNIDAFLTVSYFDITISNLPNPNALPATAAQQQGESELSGFELEGVVNLDDVSVQVALATLDAEDPNGFEISAAPDFTVSSWVTWEPEDILPGFRMGAGVRHVGKTTDENGTLSYETPSYTLGDIMLGYSVNERLDLALNVRNVTDKQYLTACLTRGDCFPGLRRSVNATLTYSF